jgi:hypothetical protein
MHRADAVSAALAVLRHARFTREKRQCLADVEHEEELIKFITAMEGGSEVVGVNQSMLDLPIGAEGMRLAWTRMADGEKMRWRWAMEKRLSDRPVVRRGFTEFVLTWASRALYADLEPLMTALMRDDEDQSLLERIAGERTGAHSWRAEAILFEMALLV